jgi:alpha-L-fucosidase
MKARISFVIVLVLSFALSTHAGCGSCEADKACTSEAKCKLTAEKIKTLEGFKTPESVVFKTRTSVAFVSNIECKEGEYWVDDGKGFVSKLDPDLQITKLRWKDSTKDAVLNAPKGLCILNGWLWMTDNTRLVGYQTKKGGERKVIEIPGAMQLNDMAADANNIYVSDKGAGIVYEVDPEKGSLKKIKAPEAVNGITFVDGKMYCVSWALHDLYELDRTGKKKPVAFGLAKHFTNLDGIEGLACGAFIVSDFVGGKVSLVTPDRKSVFTLLEMQTPADIAIDRQKMILYVPSLLGNTVEIFQLSGCGRSMIEKGPYDTSWESLKQHNPAPEWFRDAKFGIYWHWGVYSVPAFGSEWYPRWMHFSNTEEYKHHLATYGHPSEFGYHDFVPMFKAEKFDAGEWAELFKKSGARFAGPVAEHHDGFSMWASDVNPWNAGDKGPKRDIAGELEKAIRAQGMKFVATFHHARNLQRLNIPGEPFPHRRHYWASHYPPFEGMPTSTDDPELQILYGRIPEKQFIKNWQGKLFEVIDNYQPDLIWFDSWLDQIPEQAQREFLAYYFNSAEAWGKDVVVTYKQEDMPMDLAVLDLEKGRMNELTEYTWLTDDTISLGSWCYTQDLEIKPLRQVLHVLIDIVSKNGQLILNISPMADGTIPENQKQVILGIGKWLDIYGEAIYETRPWLLFGEGPTKLKAGGGFTHKQGGYLQYTTQDIRFTKKDSTIYATVLGQPEKNKELLIKSFGADTIKGDLKVTAVTMLAGKGQCKFKQTKKGLTITPNTNGHELATVFKIQTTGSAKLK